MKDIKLKQIRVDITEKLTKLKGVLTSNQISGVAYKTGYSERTVYNYLSGDIKNIEVAEKILVQSEIEISIN